MTDYTISAVIASAGAGKTFHIVNEIADEVERRDPEKIVATTFTVKAADELIERSRAKLFETGRPDKAARLLGARFGTVNAVCGQIVAEHAIALGRSPRAEVIPEGSHGHVFAIAADAAIERHAPVLNDLSEAMGYLEQKFGGEAAASDWRKSVRRIIELARSNGIAADDLTASADRSVATFLKLLPEPAENAERLDADLADAVAAAVAAIPNEVSKTAEKTVSQLRQTASALRRKDRIGWPDWARLTKCVCAKKDGQAFTDALNDVNRVASRHPTHPRLRDDCTTFIRTVFVCAAEALAAYQSHKAERGLVDFIDQEALALEALGLPEVRELIGERIGRLFVDEFQDSSPLQLAVFAALAPLVDGSTWVGDPKQAIYGFRNADSALTQAAMKGVAAQSAAAPDLLSRSYRSRVGIVELVNAAFEPALTAMGLDPAEHAFSGTARSEQGFARDAIDVWWLEGKQELQFAGLAEAIQTAVSPDSNWLVDDLDGRVRPMRTGDVAVLCRSRADVAKSAAALSALGLKVAVEREGLARTQHVELVIAAYRYVADSTDTLALAELSRFLSDDPQSDAWLRALGEDEPWRALAVSVPIVPDLDALRERILSLTPADLIDAIILLPEVTRRIESWGDAIARLDDLEALRGFARDYEANCSSAGVAATPSGLVLALAAEDPSRPRSPRDDAVTIITYHGAKGLEWPCVVLTGLAKAPRARLWEPVAEADGEIDWREPLSGRWIRFWPWPYGSQEKDVHLDVSGSASQLGVQAGVSARDEEARLLYVGMTRARDQLVLAPPAKGSLSWMSVLDGAGTPHLHLPRAEGQPITCGDLAFPSGNATLFASAELQERVVAPSFVGVARPPVKRAELYRRPSSDGRHTDYCVVERVKLGPRIPFLGSADMRILGEAMHAIIAADHGDAQWDMRLGRAQAILDRWGIHQIAAENALCACDRLWAEAARRWPDAVLHRECPVSARVGYQLIRGRIDLLVERPDGFTIVDHKSFPGAPDSWEARAIVHGAQLDLYAEALAKVRPGAASELWVHMPVVGALLRIERVGGAS